MKKNNKGFTLAELLIVVAIIAVLVAIAIPVFTTQLEKSREATDIANVRSAYAQVVTNYLTDKTNAITTMTVEHKQTVPGWQGASGIIEYFEGSAPKEYSYNAKTTGNYSVTLEINASTGNAVPKVS